MRSFARVKSLLIALSSVSGIGHAAVESKIADRADFHGVEINFTGSDVDDYQILKRGFQQAGEASSAGVKFSCSSASDCIMSISSLSPVIENGFTANRSTATLDEFKFVMLLKTPDRRETRNILINSIRNKIISHGNHELFSASLFQRVQEYSCTSDGRGRRSCGRVPTLATVFGSPVWYKSQQGNIYCTAEGADFAKCIINGSGITYDSYPSVNEVPRENVNYLVASPVVETCSEVTSRVWLHSY